MISRMLIEQDHQNHSSTEITRPMTNWQTAFQNQWQLLWSFELSVPVNKISKKQALRIEHLSIRLTKLQGFWKAFEAFQNRSIQVARKCHLTKQQKLMSLSKSFEEFLSDGQKNHDPRGSTNHRMSRAGLAEWLALPSGTRETWVLFPRSAALIMVFVVFHGSSRRMLGPYRWQVGHDRISFPPHYLLSLFFPSFPHGLQALHYAVCSWAFNVAIVALPVQFTPYLPTTECTGWSFNNEGLQGSSRTLGKDSWTEVKTGAKVPSMSFLP